MQRLDLTNLIEFGDRKFNLVVLADGTDMRVVLLCLRAGQQVPEHSAAGGITVRAITGRVTFYEGTKPTRCRPGRSCASTPKRGHHERERCPASSAPRGASNVKQDSTRSRAV